MQKTVNPVKTTQFALAAMLLLGLTACSTTKSDTTTEVKETRVTESELRAYCPSITLLEGTAFLSKYDKGGQDDPAQLVYQGTVTDTTRACKYNNGTLSMEVAASYRVVPGPKFKGGNVSLPIRVAVVEGDKTVYSKLHRPTVNISGNNAAQFVLNDNSISMPIPARQNVRVFIGFDEGPYNTK